MDQLLNNVNSVMSTYLGYSLGQCLIALIVLICAVTVIKKGMRKLFYVLMSFSIWFFMRGILTTDLISEYIADLPNTLKQIVDTIFLMIN